MKKLSVSTAILVCMFATAAIAADSGAPAPGNAGPHKEGRLKSTIDVDKKPRPRFEDCDKNNDGTLTLEEFLACCPRGGEKIFASMDADKDGKITREEWRTFREARLAEKLRKAFDLCDKNKDGVLSFEEFAQCKSEFKGKRGGRKHPGHEKDGTM